MEYSKPNLEELYAKLSIEDKEEGAIIIEEATIQGNRESLYWLGDSIHIKILILIQYKMLWPLYGEGGDGNP